MGRKPKPQALLDLQGTSRPDRKRGSGDIGRRITSLQQCYNGQIYGMDDDEKSYYKYVCQMLLANGILYATDLLSVRLYAKTSAVADRLEREWKEKGTSIDKFDKDGNLSGSIDRPAYRQWERACQRIASIGSSLGLDPLSRGKIKQEVEKDDPMTRVMAILTKPEEEPDDQ